MEIRENLNLIEVRFEQEGKKAILTFLDPERGEIREVNFNKQSYKDGKYQDDPEKAAKVDEWCKTYFNTTFGNFDRVSLSFFKNFNPCLFANDFKLTDCRRTIDVASN